MANSPSLLNRSQPNFPGVRQMDCNRKHMPETSAICRDVRLGSKKMSLLAWTGPQYIQHGCQTREFFKQAMMSEVKSGCHQKTQNINQDAKKVTSGYITDTVLLAIRQQVNYVNIHIAEQAAFGFAISLSDRLIQCCLCHLLTVKLTKKNSCHMQSQSTSPCVLFLV